MGSHLHRKKKKNDAKLQGTGLCSFLCLQWVSVAVATQKSLLGNLEGLAGLGDPALGSASPSLGRGHASWEQPAQWPLLAMPVPIQRQGWSDLPGQRQVRGHPFPKAGLFNIGTGGQAPCRGPSWERGGCWGQPLILFSGPLPCPGCPLGDLRSNARLVTAGSWQSLVLQTLGFSHQLLRVVPGGSCYFYIKTHFLIIISVLHLENQI